VQILLFAMDTCFLGVGSPPVTNQRMPHLSPKDVAAQLGISERTVRRMLNEGHLPGFRIGTKLWRTEQGFVDEYVREGQYARYRHELRRLRLRSAQRSVAKALAQATQKIDGVSDREWAMVRPLIEP
jgi:excisionase family DNA binding protein